MEPSAAYFTSCIISVMETYIGYSIYTSDINNWVLKVTYKIPPSFITIGKNGSLLLLFILNMQLEEEQRQFEKKTKIKYVYLNKLVIKALI